MRQRQAAARASAAAVAAAAAAAFLGTSALFPPATGRLAAAVRAISLRQALMGAPAVEAQAVAAAAAFLATSGLGPLAIGGAVVPSPRRHPGAAVAARQRFRRLAPSEGRAAATSPPLEGLGASPQTAAWPRALRLGWRGSRVTVALAWWGTSAHGPPTLGIHLAPPPLVRASGPPCRRGPRLGCHSCFAAVPLVRLRLWARPLRKWTSWRQQVRRPVSAVPRSRSRTWPPGSRIRSLCDIARTARIGGIPCRAPRATGVGCRSAGDCTSRWTAGPMTRMI
mmetsp:Transcript_66121/g.141502  ORF Transcript_66121/g.141502 Transcript_66121/m.141502 type:complete len:281 (+) Transcript_66121:82-924(+)